MRFPTFAAAFFALCLARVAGALPPDAAEQVKPFAGGANVERVPSDTWTISEQIHNPDGHDAPPVAPAPKPIAGGLKIGDEVLIEESPGGRVLVGSSDAPKTLKANKQFASFADYVAQNSYAPLPTPPKGLKLRQVTTVPSQPIRITSDGTGKWLYVLTGDGNVFRV